jgi:ABC-type proline/glycine betaine transport system ATPase subunit
MVADILDRFNIVVKKIFPTQLSGGHSLGGIARALIAKPSITGR